ncbi:peptidylprolyl isomerase [Paenibacillus agricola]|uniref:peptidylprolyl isomerase n=1 Tax=Paenibacillus agricola TaxID=2716264 RepID=A0ABX0JG51_9BACL|nr:peptidylprolyl isomerase [Paenibacillus agricola]NHN34761.1 hypothetical protein [Paenibacillus agricola]
MFEHHAAVLMNGKTISLRDVLKYALAMDAMPALEGLIDDRVLTSWAHERNVEVSHKELQERVNQYRQERGLFTSVATKAWLDSRQCSLAALGSLLRPGLLRDKLRRDVISDEEVRRYFYEYAAALDRVAISRLVVREYGEAKEMQYRLEEGEEFQRLAKQYSTDTATRLSGGYVGQVGRSYGTVQITDSIFGAQPGDIVGPIEMKEGYVLLQVEAQYPAVLDETTADTIMESLFEEKWQSYKLKAGIRIELWDSIRCSGEKTESGGVLP